jgi:hypothetical protein
VIDFITWGIAGVLVLLTVLIHYEAMLAVSDRIVPWAQHHYRGRRVVAFSIAALMLGHIIEIWLWAIAAMVLLHFPDFGAYSGNFDHTLNSFLYISTVDYTSLGDNNIRPIGAIRALAATETLIGMLMLGWSASFTYLKMEQIWKGPRS